MRWAHQNFDNRDMPAAKGLQAVIDLPGVAIDANRPQLRRFFVRSEEPRQFCGRLDT